MADGIFYRDLRQPVSIIDETAITLSTTQKALWPVARTILPANYWREGKTVKLTAMIKMVTDGTAGNYVFGMGLGTGDAPAVIVVGSSQAGVVSKTFGMVMEGYATCRSLGVGTAATISMWGYAIPDLSGMLSTTQQYVFPTAGATVVSTFDPTLATLALTFQAQRSGAGVWTAQTVGLLFEALN